MHEPDDYDCPFCRLQQGLPDENNQPADVVGVTDLAFARISPRWWPANPGAVLVVPRAHHENLYDLPRDVGHAVWDLTQQVALARLIIADPHTLVLDEATSLIDPRTARTLEGSMNNLLEGRTVVAIAHRLHTAHDADRIAVVIDGRIAELGSHDELLDLDGEYAALWRAWTS